VGKKEHVMIRDARMLIMVLLLMEALHLEFANQEVTAEKVISVVFSIQINALFKSDSI